MPVLILNDIVFLIWNAHYLLNYLHPQRQRLCSRYSCFLGMMLRMVGSYQLKLYCDDSLAELFSNIGPWLNTAEIIVWNLELILWTYVVRSEHSYSCLYYQPCGLLHNHQLWIVASDCKLTERVNIVTKWFVWLTIFIILS